MQLDTIVVADSDRFFPRGDPNNELPDFKWSVPGVNRCDERLERLFTTFDPDQFIVQAVETDRVGGFRLAMRRGLVLEVFPDNSFDLDCWRFFCFSRDESHLVVTGEGIEEQDDDEDDDEDDDMFA